MATEIIYPLPQAHPSDGEGLSDEWSEGEEIEEIEGRNPISVTHIPNSSDVTAIFVDVTIGTHLPHSSAVLEDVSIGADFSYPSTILEDIAIGANLTNIPS